MLPSADGSRARFSRGKAVDASRFAKARGQTLDLVSSFALIDQAEREHDAGARFYVDNHVRAYTSKHTVRKGWRTQDKRVLPGTSDYWVHDQDGRPLLR